MDKKSKDALRRYKKSRQHASHSSTESSSTDTDTGTTSSYSSTDSEHRSAERHRKKKSRRGISSSGDERRSKRDKRDHCQKKLEAKRNHLKRKLKEAKLKKRAAAAAAALSGHGHRALSPATQAKLKKLAERKHLRAASKERREREREKLRIASVQQRDREREHHRLGASRSPPTTTKIRIHQDVKGRQKSPGMLGSGIGIGGPSTSSSSRMHHQLMSREKIIIQTRTRDRTPSIERERERQRHEHKLQRHDELSLRDRERRDRERERAEREAAREKERAEALARCQERQRERERIAREKLQREEEEKYGSVSRGGGGGVGGNSNGTGSERIHGGRQLSERDHLDINAPGYGSRERSLEPVERVRHISKHDMIDVYDRERDRDNYLPEPERHGVLDDMRRYNHRRRDLSPMQEHYASRIRDPRDIYPEEDRERVYKRNASYIEPRYATSREREPWLNPRELRDREIHEPHNFRDIDNEDVIYADERERVLRDRERERERERERVLPPAAAATRSDWKHEQWADREWDDSGGSATPVRPGGFIGGPKRVGHAKQPPPTGASRSGSEPNWDADEQEIPHHTPKPEASSWVEHDQREKPRAWRANEWRDMDEGYTRGSGADGSSGGGGGVGVEPAPHHHHHAAQHSPTPHHHLHTRSERGGRGGYRRGGVIGGPAGAHGELLSERNVSSGYRPHPPPLMTLPVQPPGGYHGSNARGFPHKRMTYTNPGYSKKPMPHTPSQTPPLTLPVQRHSPTPTIPSNKTHQASAVAAATTAVAAAKAAAQSAANATTNPSILGQVTKTQYSSPADTDEKPLINDPVSGGELSEISDSDDEILNKTDKVKSKDDPLSDNPLALTQDVSTDTTSNEEPAKPEMSPTPPPDSVGSISKADDEEIDDFEEISDGELEEESRLKGISDALGVDWKALINEAREQANSALSPSANTTGKQRWQPHLLMLDLGISVRMAGASYGTQLLNESFKNQLQTEQDSTKIKLELSDTETMLESACYPSSMLSADATAGLSHMPYALTNAHHHNHHQQQQPEGSNDEKLPSIKLLPSPDDSGNNVSSMQADSKYAQSNANNNHINHENTNNCNNDIDGHNAHNNNHINDNSNNNHINENNINNNNCSSSSNGKSINANAATTTTNSSCHAPTGLVKKSIATQQLACVQVAMRRDGNLRHRMFARMCGATGRALSARNDLKLRRQLSGMPARECLSRTRQKPFSSNTKMRVVQIFEERIINVQ